LSKALHRAKNRTRAKMANSQKSTADNPIRMGMDQERVKPMSDTPIFTELNENMKQLRETAFRHGYLTAQVELIEYITEELKAKRLSPSKGIRNIVEKLTARE
jgi:hypothetical protein